MFLLTSVSVSVCNPLTFEKLDQESSSLPPSPTAPATRRHRTEAGIHLYWLVTEVHRCEKKLAPSFSATCPAETRAHDRLIASPTLY